MFRRSALFALLALAAVALVGLPSPGWGHTGVTGGALSAPFEPAPTGAGDTLHRLALVAAPEAATVPWAALLGALGAAALVWRRPRRALTFALVLLLALFAFEDGLHSVHHGVDTSRMASCALAAAAAHLSATAVDRVVPTDVNLPVLAPAPEIVQTAAVARFLCPDQGRAPPSTPA